MEPSIFLSVNLWRTLDITASLFLPDVDDLAAGPSCHIAKLGQGLQSLDILTPAVYF